MTERRCTCPKCSNPDRPRSPLASLPGWDIAKRIVAEQANTTLLNLNQEKEQWWDTGGVEA